MHKSGQLVLFAPHPTKSKKGQRETIYTPIPAAVLDRYAYDVCRKYADSHGQEYTGTEFVQGFRAFVRTLATAQTRRLNKGVAYVPQTG